MNESYPPGAMLRKSDLTLTELQRLDIDMKSRTRSRETLWALWAFLSYFGAHRYYVGDFGLGFAMFVTSVVPMIGIGIQVAATDMDSVPQTALLYFFIFWLAASLVWSWVDAFFVDRRVDGFNRQVETQILNEIAVDRNRG